MWLMTYQQSVVKKAKYLGFMPRVILPPVPRGLVPAD